MSDDTEILEYLAILMQVFQEKLPPPGSLGSPG